MFLRSLLLICLLSGIAGCANTANPLANLRSNLFIEDNYAAADRLVANIKKPLSKELPIVAATFVNLDALTESSTLGRLLSEQIASRLTQQGYSLVELKLRGSVFVKANQGELLLSREVKDLSASYSAQAVVVGTYARSGEYLYLNIKIVRPTDNLVLAASDYALPMDWNIRSLLESDKRF